MKEIWKDIPDFEGFYQISNYGRMRSLDRKVEHRNGVEYQIKKGKILRLSINRDGYVKCTVSKNSNLTSFTMHRLVGLCFIKNTYNKPCINHKNGIKNDNRMENLEWVTQSENIIHSFKNGFHKPQRGSLNGAAKLNEAQVREIRLLYATRNYLQREIASKYNISRTSISLIINYKRWSVIPVSQQLKLKY